MKSAKNGRDGRTRIIEGALRRFSQDGVSSTTLASLREESGVSVGSFYHHFASKEHVFGVLYSEIATMYQQAFVDELFRHDTAKDGIEAIVAMHMAWCGRHPERARILISERPPRREEPGGPEVAEARRAFFRRVSDWWRPHMKNGVLRPVEPTMCYVLWLGPATEMCRLWFSGAHQPTEDEIRMLGEAAWHSLKGTSGAS
ncbi:TetR family transcriptional regulator [Sphaerisporangium krabiense]|uniref:AcrR family transcriptional regulator n=1 Tax=Sphaerisporangium krabiense TaxID=763782 RepID=A0A7W9DPU8_9ACTN|nr:TetR/AcrR family transcriptional regulator [Sphaerisporangium krabiense]MBB5626334.1 AcrR family transcriptional regulator [Sphaerisporangium krabiense]GII63248.1 TetR family transcriptional regulator [Sphaerisporangium krabiense]